MARDCFRVRLVGIKYGSPPFDIKTEILTAKPSLRREPKNKFDPNAVEVTLRGSKVGYIDKTSARRISKFLADGVPYEIEVREILGSSISLKLSFGDAINRIVCPKPTARNEAGIYKISIDDEIVYIGQSVAINLRVKEHWRDLTSRSHVNRGLQREWDEKGSSKFSVSVIQTVPEGMTAGLAQQRWLAEREKYWISHYRSIKTCLNFTDGEEILTEASIKELNDENEAFDLKVRKKTEEIDAEIRSLEAKRNKALVLLKDYKQNVKSLEKLIILNTGVIGFFMRSEPTSAITKNKKELELLKAKLDACDKECNSISQKIFDLNRQRCELETRK